ncbi:MAG: hypothetical protein HY908_03695 [Myxococcales bacterium]|nr:hypothetical protein [Myxococcales bacterium]
MMRSVRGEELATLKAPAAVELGATARGLALRLALPALLVLTALLYLPSLLAPYMTDDFVHVLAWEKLPETFTRKLNLFGLIGSGAEAHSQQWWGLIPWWSSPELRINFFRPIPSLTHWLDFALFGRNAAAAHLMSIGWYIGTVVLANRLLARFIKNAHWLLVATAIFALEDAHAIDVIWVANRNEMIAASFALLSLFAYLRLRDGKGRYNGALSVAAMVGALLSKESSVVVPVLILAYAVIFPEQPGGLWARVRTRAPLHVAQILVVVAYVAIYFSLGFGPNSAYYLNPLEDPVGWLGHFVRSSGYFAAILVTGVPLHVLGNSPLLSYPVPAAILLALTAGFWWLAWRWLKDDRGFRFFLAWMLIFQPLITSSFPDPRMLFLPSLGFAYIAARVMQEAWRRRDGARSRSLRALVWTLAGLHLLVAPALAEANVQVVKSFDARYQALASSVAAAVDFSQLGDPSTDVFFLNYHQREMSTLFGLYLTQTLPSGIDDYGPLARDPNMTYPEKLEWGLAHERIHYYPLSFVQGPVKVEVVDEHEIALAPAEGPYFTSLFEELYTTGDKFAVGQVIATARFQAIIDELTPDGELRRVRFRFPEPLSSPRYRFLVWDGERFVAPPELPAPALPAPGPPAPEPASALPASVQR